MTPPLVSQRAALPELGQQADTEYPHFLAYARELEREHPEHLGALGMTAEQYARSMIGPSLTIEESVEGGWMSAAEGRFIQGRATLEDLLELGHAPDEAHAILLDQQERACASSTCVVIDVVTGRLTSLCVVSRRARTW